MDSSFTYRLDVWKHVFLTNSLSIACISVTNKVEIHVYTSNIPNGYIVGAIQVTNFYFVELDSLYASLLQPTYQFKNVPSAYSLCL